MTIFKKRIAFIAISTLLVTSAALPQGVVAQEESLRAGDIKAGYVACEKFSYFIGRLRPDGDLGRFLSDINNYKVKIKSDRDGYVVEFQPVPYEGALLNGGGALYHVDGTSFEVTSEKHYK
ncbi:hypothetical protein L2Y96_02680 [Luteibacter aegosomaticola]|uniref:hypothetical protein n=1 Tax=Luteibacter aegosomaticola TaxID=2911538 RepID=UPI001FF8E7C2|nr:hypothetical protein [Luteibacter aegosomaticola]UPG90697.1 hypothetical protein L2Y96_02680 [Luteibacter aegosomaticola]